MLGFSAEISNATSKQNGEMQIKSTENILKIISF